MSFSTTVKKALRYPNLAQAGDIADIVQKLAEDVDSYTAGYTQGLFSARPAAGKSGQIFYATDSGAVYLDNGTTWKVIGTTNLLDLLANIPAANTVSPGTEFFATDQNAQYISDGTNWIRIGTPSGTTNIQLGSAADAGYILLQGQAWPATTGIYADLHTKLGGSTLPDFREYVPVGYKSGSTEFGTLLGAFGEKTHTLTSAEMAHDHVLPSNTTIFPSGSTPVPQGGNPTGAVADVSASGHNNIQLSRVVNFQAKL